MLVCGRWRLTSICARSSRLRSLSSSLSQRAPSAAMSSSSAASSQPPAHVRVVEIEKKVKIAHNTEKMLYTLGFRQHGVTASFTDTYLDDEYCTLTTSNYWLRRRDATWELKFPTTARSTGEAQAAQRQTGLSSYEEQTKDALIVATVQALYARAQVPGPALHQLQVPEATRREPVQELVIGQADEQGWPQLMGLIRTRALFPVVHLRTSRRTLTHPSAPTATSLPASSSSSSLDSPHADFTVVLDEADYLRDAPPRSDGQPPPPRTFTLAEVELVLHDPTASDMRKAEERVNAFAALLEPQGDAGEDVRTVPAGTHAVSEESADVIPLAQLPRGKVERFLALYRPWHMKLLQAVAASGKSA